MSNLFVDIHVLQTLPPNNINRDESGSPKTAIYGGTVRQRVSSQAWKRAIRTDFGTKFDADKLGVRTKDVVKLVADEITALAPEHEGNALAWAQTSLEAAKIKVAVPKGRAKTKPQAGEPVEPEALPESAYLIFMGAAQAENLAQLAIDTEGKPVKKDAVAALNANQAIDVALFGRMLADAKELSVDASTQVAHAISVHEAVPEFDYFTAMDDKRGEDEAGADMIGTVEFTSSTLYRYATINVGALNKTLGDATVAAEATAQFIDSFVRAMPTGKKNTFANGTLPDAIVLSFSNEQPLSWVGAFEQAVTADFGGSRLEKSAVELANHVKSFDEAYGLITTRHVSAASKATESLKELGNSASLPELTKIANQAVLDHLGRAE
ncbi:type I-E CRISPR-associated protein Cas7/Cse4/CasC [Arthrobacter sp. MYb227]|uniref:type I-E CRISPR-associated protein Cas7/Cse4/CasC n=1 Tax=Arthrobacter sp. MYb227 TaxID=1848601 RepID=UPI000CFDAF26|nr:type I-E CRISPR-associated protein Cas7/Cse4/CasC [Arthrobacter sp. MYb227]PQZ94894.1 type I-E CRISPR-associated protein Cas7/Cse4/CasC [Arthrobacter sp. MYb227]